MTIRRPSFAALNGLAILLFLATCTRLPGLRLAALPLDVKDKQAEQLDPARPSSGLGAAALGPDVQNTTTSEFDDGGEPGATPNATANASNGRMVLLTSHFAPRKPEHPHFPEIQAAIAANLANPLFDEVHVIYELAEGHTCANFRNTLLLLLLEHWRPGGPGSAREATEKLRCIPHDGQPTYRDMLVRYGNRSELEGSVVVMANADMVFDLTIARVRDVPPNNVHLLTLNDGPRFESKLSGLPVTLPPHLSGADEKNHTAALRALYLNATGSKSACGQKNLCHRMVYSWDGYAFRAPLPPLWNKGALKSGVTRLLGEVHLDLRYYPVLLGLAKEPTSALLPISAEQRLLEPLRMNSMGAEHRIKCLLDEMGVRVHSPCAHVRVSAWHCTRKMHAGAGWASQYAVTKAKQTGVHRGVPTMILICASMGTRVRSFPALCNCSERCGGLHDIATC